MRNLIPLLLAGLFFPALVAISLSGEPVQDTETPREQPPSPTWTTRLTMVLSSTQGREVSDAEAELIANMIWLANTDQQAKSNEAKSELAVKLIGQFISDQAGKGAAKQGVLSFQQQLTTAARGTQKE
jgi:hypothetical protein